MKIIKAADRHFNDLGWLKTYWLFSFDSYVDPENNGLGNLRVFNDDIVIPDQGFGMHPHREMEIISIILRGEITHEDSMGNKTVIRAGEVQRMSAGRGVTHSEQNLGQEPLHLYQIWIFPHTRSLEPQYEQIKLPDPMPKNSLLPIASGEKIEGVLSINADASIYIGNLEEGEAVSFESRYREGIFVYLTEGTLSLNGHSLSDGDQARLAKLESLDIKATADSRFILIDVSERSR